MLTLDGKKWAGFCISDIAEIVSGRDINDEDKQPGDIPYISSSALNNGISHFVSNTNETLEAGCISVCRTGSVGYAFYHPYEALYSSNVRKLRLKAGKNKYISLFIATQITAQHERFSYGYILGTARLARQKIMLPVDDEGQPDYAFMEEFMKEREQKMIREEIAHIRAQIRGSESLTLDGRKWAGFRIGELFTVKIGKSIDGNKIDKLAGKTPYITRKESDNGLDGFIDHKNSCLNTEHPVITIGNETAEPFVQDFPFFTGTKVNILIPKTPQTKQALLFAAQSLKIHKERYSYAFTINSTRLKKQMIQLPVNDTGQPDWDFMTEYTRAIEQRLYLRYLEAKQ